MLRGETRIEVIWMSGVASLTVSHSIDKYFTKTWLWIKLAHAENLWIVSESKQKLTFCNKDGNAGFSREWKFDSDMWTHANKSNVPFCFWFALQGASGKFDMKCIRSRFFSCIDHVWLRRIQCKPAGLRFYPFLFWQSQVDSTCPKSWNS